jgi:hypothetical protein
LADKQRGGQQTRPNTGARREPGVRIVLDSAGEKNSLTSAAGAIELGGMHSSMRNGADSALLERICAAYVKATDSAKRFLTSTLRLHDGTP